MDPVSDPTLSDSAWTRFQRFAWTRQGGLILLEMILCVAITICCLCSHYVGYVACPLIELIFAGIFYWVYMNGFHRTLISLNWRWTDIFRCASAAVILLVISLINVTRNHVGNVLAGLFGFTAMTAFIYNAYFLSPQCLHQPPKTDDPPAYTP